MDKKLLLSVWKRQPGKYYCVSRKNNGHWQDKAFDNPNEAIEWLSEDPKADCYWCPTSFDKPKRIKDNIPGSYFLWSDLDTADPRKFPRSLRPTIAWETSPGRFHGLWELEKPLKGPELEQLNRDMTYHFVSQGADKGGWDLTQVLRIPGTKNHKYPDKPKVTLLWNKKNKKYKVSVLKSLVGGSSDSAVTEAPSGDNAGFNEALARNMKQIPKRTLRLLLAEHAEEGRRSDVIWALTHQLTESGIAAGDIEALIRGSVWNKYKGRHDELKRIRHEIASAVTKTAANSPTEVEYRRREDDEPAKLAFTIESDEYLMMRGDTNPGWLVDQFWTRNSYGIVAGEPKSFKSFLVQDLAISVASGVPFLGQFNVNQKGPVLIVQNENAPWIIKNRAEKIRASKGLVGNIQPSKNGHIDVEFPDPLPIYYINQSSVVIDNPVHQKLLQQAVEEIEPVLVVLDPLYLMMSGDISNAKDLNPILTWLLEFKKAHNFSLILIHHMHKDKSGGSRRGGQRMLGSVTLHGWVESAWYLDVMDETEDNHDHKSWLKLEREFRGTASPPKARIGITVGEWDSYDYSVSYDARLPNKSMPRVSANQVAQTLESTRKSMTVEELASETTLSKKAVTQALEELIDQNAVKKYKSGYKWTGR